MKDTIQNAMSILGFDGEAVAALSRDLEHLLCDPACTEALTACATAYNADPQGLDDLWLAQVADTARNVGISPYSAHMLLLLLLSASLRTRYEEHGIGDAIWLGSMLDLKWKLWECRAVKGEWGTFVPHWFLGFFHLTRFALGRLQFEIVKCKTSYERDSVRLTTDSDVINVHIPRTLTPLTRESCIDAYRQAAEFFADHFNGAPMAFVCSSWLLYPPTAEILPPKSNIRTFIGDYRVILEKKDPDGQRPNAWRLFDMDDTGNVEDYPEDSSLRRSFKQYLKQGGSMGSGYGIFLADANSFL